MEYGCIGEKLGHSFSKEIHGALADYSYELCEVARDKLDEFMIKADFRAINVTIPYKEAVIPHLSWIDEAARAIGAVNTIVKKDGKLFGYNTDFYGMSRLIRHAKIEIRGKKVAILGTGGTSKTANAVVRSLGASSVLTVSRAPTESAISYGELISKHTDTEIIINTTPVGMYPRVFDAPLDLSPFYKLSGVVDAVYNPLRTPLILAAKARGIPAEGGLYMLVAQGVRASEIFLDTVYPDEACDEVFGKMMKNKESVVLIGMPGSGKSTVGKLLADKTGKRFIDTDTLITDRIGMPISEYFRKYGEGEFRERESEVIRDICSVGGAVIATGGGAVLREDNVRNLKKNGRTYFLDRPIDDLIPTSDRPLASDRAAIEKRYNERYEIYCGAADEHIAVDCDAKTLAKRIGGAD